MPNIQEIMKQIQKDLSCPVCGKKYELEDIKLRGFFDHALIVQTVCTQGHNTLFMTVYNKIKEEKKPITSDDVLDLANILKSFNGDFQKIWASQHLS